jgi:hypothetical protein
MAKLFKQTLVFVLTFGVLGLMAFFNQDNTKKLTSPQTNAQQQPQKPKKTNAKIQAAILLDVSGSMNGLIEQAKAQLWNMVNTMGKVTCQGATPQIEIALYEYGRPSNGSAKGYVKKISDFTTDLDLLSQKLFSLSIDGGDEYCGKVINTSIDELQWDTASSNYKVIFIAGNEDFLQGNVHYTKACANANKKGVIVNTIYCGDKQQGIMEHWNLIGECGNGSYTNINQNAVIDDIATPYDTTLMALNTQLNGTYIGYGAVGNANVSRQVSVDAMNFSMSKTAGLKRAKTKSNAGVYKNGDWDLVDAMADKKVVLKQLDKSQLADSLKLKTEEQLKAIIEVKSKERVALQLKMATINAQRDAYINTAKLNNQQSTTNTATLETEIEKIIKLQIRKFNMVIQ